MKQRNLDNIRNRRILNWPLAMGSLLVIAILVPSTILLHNAQLTGVTQAMLTLIQTHRENEEWDKAATYTQRYLLLRPEDGERKIELAELFDKTAASVPQIQRVITLQSIAIGACEANKALEPKAESIRRRMTERLMQVARFEDALDQIGKIAGPTPDFELEQWLAICRYRLAIDKRTHSLPVATQSRLPEWFSSLNEMNVIDLLQKALIDNPGNVPLSRTLSEACLGDPEFLRGSQLDGESIQELKKRAVSIADRMLAVHREEVSVWLSHFSVLSQIDRIAAESDIQQALVLAPDDPQVLMQAGDHFLQRSKSANLSSELAQKDAWLEQSERYLKRVREKASTRDANLFLTLGEVLIEQNRLDEAIEIWRDGIRIGAPPVTNLHFRIVETLLKQKNYDKALVELQSMDESIRRDGPSLPRNYQNSVVRVGKQQWASYYVAKGDFRLAIGMMEQVVSRNRELDAINQAEIWGFLASAYYQMGQWDRSASAFEQAVVLAPTVAQFRRGAASAWFAAQRFNESLKQLQFIEFKSGADWILIAETVLEMQRRQRPDAGLWNVLDNCLFEAGRMLKEKPESFDRPWLLDLLSIDAAVLRSEPDSLRSTYLLSSEKLVELCKQFPKSDDLWYRAISRMRKWGETKNSGELLAELRGRAQDSVESALGQAEFLIQDGKADEARQVIQARLDKEPNNETLLRAIVQLSSGSDAIDDINNKSGDSFAKLRSLSDLALKTPVILDLSELQNPTTVDQRVSVWNSRAEKLEKRLREIEGDAGTEWRYMRARRLLTVASFAKAKDYSEAIEISNYLDRQRPQWTATHVLLGMLAERQDKIPFAIKEFTRAIQLGVQDIGIFERLAEMLYRQGMLAEASALIERLGDRANESSRLSSLAIGLASKSKSDALGVAKSGTIARPGDPLAWVWYAQMLEVTSRASDESQRVSCITEAQSALDRANQLTNNSDIRVLSAEFNFYLGSKQLSKSDEVIERIKALQEIPAPLRWTTLAQMYQILNKLDLAVESYEQAISSGGDRKEIGSRLSQMFLLQGNRDQAIERMEAINKEFPADTTVKRSLATLLAARGYQEDWKKVNLLLTGSQSSYVPDDLRLQAELFAQKGSQSDLAQAQLLLERLVDDPNNRTDQDRFRLASVYLRNARVLVLKDSNSNQSRQLQESAARQLKMAASGLQPTPDYIYAYADFLLEQGRNGEASEQLDRLSLLAPDGFSSILLKARLQFLDKKEAEAKRTILNWLEVRRKEITNRENDSRLAELLLKSGQALAMVKADTESEKVLREAYELDDRLGMDYVRSLSRSQDSISRNNAIEFLVERIKKAKTTEPAKLLAVLLSVGDFDPALRENAESILMKFEAGNENDADLLLTVADMWLSQNRVKPAVDTYRRIIKIRPNDVVALNNLANLLAEQPGATDEAIGYIDQAIRIAGRQPLLIDTKGAILLFGKRVKEAIPLFQDAVAASSDPRLALHLYVALNRDGRNQEADRVRNALDLNELRKALLTPDDQDELEKLESGTAGK